MMARKRKGFEDGTDVPAHAARKVLAKWGGKERESGKLLADWGLVDPSLISGLLSAAGRFKGACLLGVDRQGVGYTVSVFIGGEKVVNQWYRGDPEGVERLHFDIEDMTNDLLSDGESE